MATIADREKRRRLWRFAAGVALIAGLVMAGRSSIAYAQESKSRTGIDIMSADIAEIYLSYDPFVSYRSGASPSPSDKIPVRASKALSLNRPSIRIPIRPELRSPFAP